tara:strand:+ start:1368 stop:1970 length:603 start_codon:yes stop_codon:yes gene_type:complete
MANTARRSDGKKSQMSASYMSKYLDFVAGNCSNLTGTPVAITQSEGNTAVGSSDAAEVLAATMNADAINTCASDGSAASLNILPVCTKGTHTVLHITGDIDQTGALTIAATNATSGAAGEFAFQVIQPENGYASAQAVITAGTAAAPTSVNMIYTAAAADTNFLGVGSLIHFFAVQENEWLVKVFNVKEGTGATGTFTVS